MTDLCSLLMQGGCSPQSLFFFFKLMGSASSVKSHILNAIWHFKCPKK